MKALKALFYAGLSALYTLVKEGQKWRIEFATMTESQRREATNTGILENLKSLSARFFSPIFVLRGEAGRKTGVQESEIIGAIANVIASNVGKLNPQIVRQTQEGQQIRTDHLARLLASRWAPEISAYDALYKMASDLVYTSNAFAVVFYNQDFTRIEQITPITAVSFRIFEDSGELFFRFTWAYDMREYTLPYRFVIHLKARYNRNRFLGTAPDAQIKNSLELLDATGTAIENMVKNGANLKGYLKYNNFIDEEEMKLKVREFQEAYMSAENSGGIAGIDNQYEFHEITQKNQVIPTSQSQYFRENIYRYFLVNEKILNSDFDEKTWNAFYEGVIEPVAIQLSLECTYKLLSERERGHGSRIIFTSNRLQYATLDTRLRMAGEAADRGAITINEYRELLYYPPIDGGDVRIISLNYVKTDDQSIYQIGKDPDPGEGQPEEKDAAVKKERLPKAQRRRGRRR